MVTPKGWFDLGNLIASVQCSEEPLPPTRFEKKKKRRRKLIGDQTRMTTRLDLVDEEQDEEDLVYCTKGSLCSRRSKATLLSTPSTRKIKGRLFINSKVKQRHALAIPPPPNCSLFAAATSSYSSKARIGGVLYI